MKRLHVALSVLLVAAAARADAPAATARPTEADWRAAPAFPLVRPTALCTAKRHGDWIGLDCLPNDWVVRFAQLAGSSDGVVLEAKKRAGAHAIFPIRRGDRRLFTVHRLADLSSYTVREEVGAVISEAWIDGEDAPTIVVD